MSDTEHTIPVSTGFGYSETKLADDEYDVCFAGKTSSIIHYTDPVSKKDTANYEDKARLRAAEVTLVLGYKYFVIESDKVSPVSMDREGQLCSTTGNDDCSGTFCDDDGYCEDVDLSQGSVIVTLHIKLLKSLDSSVSGALDAQSIYNSLAPKYKIPLPTSYKTINPGYTCGNI
jgi:hypothetical protein